MKRPPVHPKDEQLLRFSDRELSPRRSAVIRRHLAECSSCEGRVTELQNTLAQFVEFHNEKIQGSALRSPELRDRVKKRLTADARRTLPRWSGTGMFSRQLAGAGAALLIVAGWFWAMHSAPSVLRLPRSAIELASGLPQRQLTPGVARTPRIEDLCNSKIENDPPVPLSVKKTIFEEYGLPPSVKDHYEVDYLISPSLGGTAEIRNLWPEPSSSTSWNAHAKDELEGRLHQLVCQGTLPLEVAQNEIAQDWIAAYKRYFHIDRPI